MGHLLILDGVDLGVAARGAAKHPSTRDSDGPGAGAVTKRNTPKPTINGHEKKATPTASKPTSAGNRSGRVTVVSAINVRRGGSVRMAAARQVAPIVQGGPASR